MSKTTSSLLLAAGVLGAAWLLNPSAERHRSRIKETISERSPIEKAFAIGPLTAFVSQYHSIGIASYTTVQGKTKTIGVLGVVFVLD